MKSTESNFGGIIRLIVVLLGAVLAVIFIINDGNHTKLPNECPSATYLIASHDEKLVLMINDRGDHGEIWPARCRDFEWSGTKSSLDSFSKQDIIRVTRLLPCKFPLVYEGTHDQLIWSCETKSPPDN